MIERKKDREKGKGDREIRRKSERVIERQSNIEKD